MAAAVTFGVPHPPGTPLYVLAGRVTVLALASVDPAVALSALSAACTAAACGIAGALVAGWMRSGAAGLAAAIAGGTASSVWLNATEPEVYSVALLLVACTLWSADRARCTGSEPHARLTGYAVSLGAPLHLSALLGAPAAAVLLLGDGAPPRRAWALAVAATFVAAVGVGTASIPILAAGVVALAGAALAGAGGRRVATAAALLAVAASAFLVLLIRARHDPAVNQGNPATWAALLDVVGRRQYAHAGLWPRQAPLWLQLVNVLEYADWQFGLALAPGPPPTPLRTGTTLAFATLGVVGSRAHRRVHRESWRALLVLLVSATLGVALYLNFKAGPSIGWGILPDSAPHEARERDYFYALGFWAWGLWAGVGAVAVAVRLRPAARPLGVLVACAPIALNWAAVDRRREPAASLARRSATALLEAAPPGAVLFAAGDNDSYPLWYAQQALGVRRDVTVITVPLLPAAWYRAELARRHRLLAAPDTAVAWRGEPAVLAAAGASARALGRPVAVLATLEAPRRAAVGRAWRFDGLLYHALPDTGAPTGVQLDRERARAHAAALGAGVTPPPEARVDPTVRYMLGILSCPAAVTRAGMDRVADSLLATRCNGP